MEFFYYVYLFRIKATGKVIYVGSTRTVGEIINEHRRSMREDDRAQPIHKYLHANHLELIKDVEIDIVDYAKSKQKGLELESYYYHKYEITAINVWDANKRDGNNSPRQRRLVSKDGKDFYNSQRDAAVKLGITRSAVAQMVKRGELIPQLIPDKYQNIETGERFASGYQVQHLYNLDSKTINKLNKNGEIIVNGMTIRKV